MAEGDWKTREGRYSKWLVYGDSDWDYFSLAEASSFALSSAAKMMHKKYVIVDIIRKFCTSDMFVGNDPKSLLSEWKELHGSFREKLGINLKQHVSDLTEAEAFFAKHLKMESKAFFAMMQRFVLKKMWIVLKKMWF